MRRTILLPLAVAAAVGLAACGSGGDDTTSTSAGSTGTATTTTPETTSGAAAAVPGETRLTGSGYAFSLPGSGWSDRRAALPASRRGSFDRLFSQGRPDDDRPLVQVTRTPVPATVRNRPQALPRFAAEFRKSVVERGFAVGRASTTTLDGERTIVLPATRRTEEGRTIYVRNLLTVHDGIATGVSTGGLSEDRGTVDRLTDTARRTWRWTP